MKSNKRLTKIFLLVITVVLVALILASCQSGALAFFSSKGKDAETLNQPIVSGKGSNGPKNEDEVVEFTATFHTNADDALEPIKAKVIESSPSITFRDYIFSGWFLTSDFSDSAVSFPYTLTKNTDFYAKWTTSGTREIRTAAELNEIRLAMSGKYILMNDIFLNEYDWVPLGLKLKAGTKLDSTKVALDGAIVPFTGELDGNGFTVYGLTMTPPAEEEEFNYLPYGLFSILGQGGILKNIRLNSFKITLSGAFSDFYIGSLVGLMNEGLIQNSHAAGIINNPKIDYTGTIWDDFLGSSATPTENTFLGGLIGGIVKGEVKNSSTEGTLVSESVAEGVFVGGLAGFNWMGDIYKSRSSMTVKGRVAGGLVGYNNSTVTASSATGSVSGSLSYPAVAGGLVGYNDIDGIIERNFAIGSVSARTAGGLIGINMFNFSKNPPINIAGDPVMQAVGTSAGEITQGKGGKVLNNIATGNVHASEYGGGLIARAESALPVKGRIDVKAEVTPSFHFISHNLAFGSVQVIAEEIIFESDDGTGEVISKGIYYSVFAGGLIGHSYESRINSSIAYGNVTAVSKRPINETGGTLYNSTYAGSVIGFSSAQLDFSEGSFLTISAKDVYGVATQKVTVNGNLSTRTDKTEMLAFSGSDGNNANNAAYYTRRQDLGGLGFDSAIWNFTNIDIPSGRRPSLR